MNIAYQLNLGPDAWPALLDLARNLPSGAERADLILGLRELARRNPETPPNWREQQFRRDRNAAALSAWARPLGDLTPGERDAPIIQRHYQTEKELRALR